MAKRYDELCIGRSSIDLYANDLGAPLKVYRARPFKVQVLNVLGASDSYASGFLHGHLQGWDWAKSARTGNATGAIVVTRQGCANAMATLNEAMEFIESQGGF